MKALTVLCAFALGVAAASGALAQQPARTTRIVMPFPAGAAADSVARTVARPLAEALGHPVVVDNRPGADGAMAAELVAKAPPDGYTLLSAGNTQMLGVPILRKNPPYDPIADFAPITPLVRFAFFLVVHPGVPANTLAELIEHARAHPGRLNYGSGNVNGLLAAAQLASAGGLVMVHVPYKGEPLAMPDLLDGRLHLMFASGAIVAPLVRQQKLRALGTLMPARSALLPDVPTVAEVGMPQLSVPLWGGLFAPAKTPKEVVDRLSREVNVILRRREIVEQLEKLGVQPSGTTPEEFAAFLRSQLADWGRAAREAGLKPE